MRVVITIERCRTCLLRLRCIAARAPLRVALKPHAVDQCEIRQGCGRSQMTAPTLPIASQCTGTPNRAPVLCAIARLESGSGPRSPLHVLRTATVMKNYRNGLTVGLTLNTTLLVALAQSKFLNGHALRPQAFGEAPRGAQKLGALRIVAGDGSCGSIRNDLASTNITSCVVVQRSGCCNPVSPGSGRITPRRNARSAVPSSIAAQLPVRAGPRPPITRWRPRSRAITTIWAKALRPARLACLSAAGPRSLTVRHPVALCATLAAGGRRANACARSAILNRLGKALNLWWQAADENDAVGWARNQGLASSALATGQRFRSSPLRTEVGYEP
jgi:hypothetical protein